MASPGLTWWFYEVIENSSYFSVPPFSAICLLSWEVNFLIQDGSWNLFCWVLPEFQPTESRRKGEAEGGMHLPAESPPSKEFPRSAARYSLTSHWPGLSHMATCNCKGGWQMQVICLPEGITPLHHYPPDGKGEGERIMFHSLLLCLSPESACYSY